MGSPVFASRSAFRPRPGFGPARHPGVGSGSGAGRDRPGSGATRSPPGSVPVGTPLRVAPSPRARVRSRARLGDRGRSTGPPIVGGTSTRRAVRYRRRSRPAPARRSASRSCGGTVGPTPSVANLRSTRGRWRPTPALALRGSPKKVRASPAARRRRRDRPGDSGRLRRARRRRSHGPGPRSRIDVRWCAERVSSCPSRHHNDGGVSLTRTHCRARRSQPARSGAWRTRPNPPRSQASMVTLRVGDSSGTRSSSVARSTSSM